MDYIIKNSNEYVLEISNALFNYNIVESSQMEVVKDYVYDKILTVLTFFRKSTASAPEPKEEKLKINKIHQINHPEPPKQISQNVNITDFHYIIIKSDPQTVYHIDYTYEETPYRIVLKPDQLHQIHKIFEEENHPSMEIESVTSSPGPEPEQNHHEIMCMYAGPLGDFYQFLDLDHHEPHYGKYFLTDDCESFLLGEPHHTIQVEDILGQDYTFSHSSKD